MADDALALSVPAARMDEAAAPAIVTDLIDAIAQDGGFRVLLDLSAVRFIDSSGIGALIQVRNHVVVENDGTFGMHGVRQIPRRVLDMMGLLEVLGVQDG